VLRKVKELSGNGEEYSRELKRLEQVTVKPRDRTPSLSEYGALKKPGSQQGSKRLELRAENGRREENPTRRGTVKRRNNTAKVRDVCQKGGSPRKETNETELKW